MKFTRRNAMGVLAAGFPALKTSAAFAAQAGAPRIEAGPFQPTRASLEAYEPPKWFRDAKLGIWAHWGPQSAAEQGDWYARNMYIEGNRQYEVHARVFGHPSKSGYKDVIPTWKAARFDADHLVGLYRRAGARYFVSMGVHHDNFDLWNSRHHRWNAVKMGPKKDIVGMFRDAARKHGLRFGVSEHLFRSYNWFQVSHGQDATGPYKGVPYDGNDPKYADLYFAKHPTPDRHRMTDPSTMPESWKREWFLRIKDLVDHYQPDLLYSDGGIRDEKWGVAMLANLYNLSAKLHQGKVEAVYTSKRPSDSEHGTCVLDIERGIVNSIWPRPWETDTCIGHWHYDINATYKSPKLVVDMLVDIVSKNGNLLLNFPLPNDGHLDYQEEWILAELTKWLDTNGEAIFETRPWKMFGEGPESAGSKKQSKFNERNRKLLTAEDVRFTTKGGALYAFFMGWPEPPRTEVNIRPLGTSSELKPGKIESVTMLGTGEPLRWRQTPRGLTVTMPRQRPCDYASALKIIGA